MRRLLLSLALLAVLADPLALAVRAVATGEHECNDHVCACSARCPPRRSAARDHCQGAPKPAAAMRGACNHDKTTALPSATVAVLVAAALVPESTGPEPVDPSPDPRAPSGFVRLDPHPPRAL